MRSDINEFIKRLFREERYLLNKSEMSRRFDCDPSTISIYFKFSSGELIPKESERKYTSLLDNYKSIITNKVAVHGATAMAVYKFILKKCYDGKYSTVADFVHKQKNLKRLYISLIIRLIQSSQYINLSFLSRMPNSVEFSYLERLDNLHSILLMIKLTSILPPRLDFWSNSRGAVQWDVCFFYKIQYIFMKDIKHQECKLLCMQ